MNLNLSSKSSKSTCKEIDSLAFKTCKLSPTLIRKWTDHHQSSAVKGLLPKNYQYYTAEFNISVVEAYNNKELSLRDCCLHFNIPTLSIVSTWLKQYESVGLDGLVEQNGRPCIMKKINPIIRNNFP